MPEALVERGIGETRAIVVAGGAIVEAHVERDDGAWRFGDVRRVRLATILVPGVRGIVTADGIEALLTPLPSALTEGSALNVAVIREALPEAGRPRLAKVEVADRPVGAGARLTERLAARDLVVLELSAHGPDLLEQSGWGEAVEAALTGRVAFPGGSLTISPTPAMTVIDVDGDLPPLPLALAAADAGAAAIACFDLTGSIGIDFPTVGGKAARTAIGARLDAALPAPFERTAVNGFGFVQIVRPRHRASFIETLRADPAATAALALLRIAERDGFGGGELVGAPAVIQWLMARPALVTELERRRGGRIGLRIEPALPISGAYVAPLR
jgi:Ribonuclease G/E